MRIGFNLVRGQYAGKPILRRPLFWITRLKWVGNKVITIYNFSMFRVWLLVIIKPSKGRE